MARLLVYRDGILNQDITLDPSTLEARDLRVGRHADSDVVLEDTDKTVSRQHAELRYEHGEYVLLDLGSPNGVWVDGNRVPRIALKNNLRVTIGPYELTIDESVPHPARPVDSSVTNKTAPMIEAVPQGSHQRTTQEAPSRRKPRPRTSSAEPAVRPGVIAWLARQPKPVVLGGFLLILIVVTGMRAFFSPPNSAVTSTSVASEEISPDEPATNDELVTELISSAQAALLRGELPDALEYLDRILLIDRSHPEALDMKARVVEGIRQLDSAASNETDDVITDAGTEENIPSVSEEQARLDGEQQRQRAAAVRAREEILALEARLDGIRLTLEQGDFSQAILSLEEFIQDNPNHEEATDLLVSTRELAIRTGRDMFDRAVRAEAESEWENAIAGYERAQELDSSIFGVKEAVERVRGRMMEAGVDAYSRARQYDALGRVPEAVALYERALRLLPRDHTDYQQTQERLTNLSAGPR